MSDRRRPAQLELFSFDPPAQSAGLIDGLEVHIERPCRHCRSTVTTIVEGRGPHSAALECVGCGRYRQWLARACCVFLSELVIRCGRPAEPIRIFEQVNRTA